MLEIKINRFPSFTGMELSGQNGTQSIQCLHLSSVNGIITRQSPVSTRRDVAAHTLRACVDILPGDLLIMSLEYQFFIFYPTFNGFHCLSECFHISLYQVLLMGELITGRIRPCPL